MVEAGLPVLPSGLDASYLNSVAPEARAALAEAGTQQQALQLLDTYSVGERGEALARCDALPGGPLHAMTARQPGTSVADTDLAAAYWTGLGQQ